jgi:hypothetical protein
MNEDATVTMPEAVDPFVGQTINERFVITSLLPDSMMTDPRVFANWPDRVRGVCRLLSKRQ